MQWFVYIWYYGSSYGYSIGRIYFCRLVGYGVHWNGDLYANNERQSDSDIYAHNSPNEFEYYKWCGAYKWHRFDKMRKGQSDQLALGSGNVHDG